MKCFRSFLHVMVLLLPLSVLSCSKNTSASNDSQASVQKEKLILGFSQVGSESAWRTRNTESIFEAASQNNIQVVFSDAQQKQSNQLKAIRSFIVYQVDVIAFVPIVEDGWDNVLQEAKDAGIPVIVVDRQINADPSLYAGFLGEDSYEEGRMAGNFLLRKCQNDPRQEINILEMAGTRNSSVARGRSIGFLDTIQQDPRFKIIHSVDGDFLRSRGREIANGIIEQSGGLEYDGKPIDIVYSHNDSMTLGMLDSLKEKMIPPQSIIIVSIDAEQKSIDALTQGKISCVVECNPNLGEDLMKMVKTLASGGEIPAVTYTKEQIFTEDDDFSLYEPRGY